MVFSAVLAFYVAERAGAEEAKKIDLSAISKYVDDWTARDTFPDSPSFAYMNVYCRLALGGQVSDATKKRIIDYLTGCQKRDGGFVTNPEDKEERLPVPTLSLHTLPWPHSISSVPLRLWTRRKLSNSSCPWCRKTEQ